jgi:hypothetical protein
MTMVDLKRYEKALERFEDLLTLAEVLMTDVTDTEKKIDTHNPSSKRNYVRSVFAMVEGGINAICSTILEAKDMAGWVLSADEVDTLSDSTFFFNQNAIMTGKRRRFAPLLKRIKVAFAISRKMMNEDCGMDFTGKDWNRFRKALEIRHRLSHPKQSIDLEISNGDIALTDAARDWFRLGVQRFFKTIKNYLKHIFELERGT